MTSKDAIRMREYRRKIKENEVNKTMLLLKISKEEAEEIAIKNIRNKNKLYKQQQRQSKQVRNKSHKDNIKVGSNELVVEEDFILKLKVRKLVILQDDKDMWKKLSNVEKIIIDRMNTYNSKVNKQVNSKVRSLIQYLNKVKSIYKKLNKDFTDINVLTDTDTIINMLKDYKGRKDYYSAIIAFLRAFKDKKKYIDIYKNEMKRSKDIVILEQKNNEKTKTQKDNWLKYDTILSLFKQNKKYLNDKDKLLLTLIIYYPRRVQDYQKLRLHKNKGKKDLNYNYLNINKYKEPTTFDFFRSKSQEYEKLGTNQKIPNSVKSTIKEYLRSNVVNNNDLLFSKEDGTMFSTDGFSKKIRKLFKDITGKDITMNLYRHIIATNLTNKKVSINKRELISNQMGHSYNTNLIYSKHK
jgi:hypothetical protein